MNRRRRLVGVSIVVVIIAAVVIFAIVSKLNKPAQGLVSNPTSAQSAQAVIDLSPTPGGGRYASFSYPSIMQQVVSSKLITPVVAIYNYSYRDVESWKLAIEVLQIPSGQLADNNSYQTRKLNSQQYQESHETINSQVIDVMTDKTVGGFSKVAFLVSGQYQATISLYGDDPSGVDILQKTFDMVLGNWHWLVN